MTDRPLAVVCLAAGRGTRMASSLHKVLHPIAGQPMLFHLLDSVAGLAPARTILVVGDRGEQVADAVAGRAVETVRQEPQLGTGHAVLQARPLLDGFAGDILILFGDAPFVRPQTMRAMRAALGDGTGNGADIAVLGFRPAEPGAYGRILADASGTVLRMVEAKDATADELAVGLCNAGPMAVRAAALWPLLAQLTNANAAGEYYLPDLVALGRAEGVAARVVEAGADELLGVNSRAELAAAEAAFQARARAAAMAQGATLVAPETVFLAHDTVLEADVTVEPFVVFGPGVRVCEGARVRSHSHLEGATVGAGCEVGPFARLRPGTLLEPGAKVGNFVETKKARLGRGAKANHLSYLGDATVGAGANIGAGTITCNYDGFAKHETMIGAGAFIGSNSALVAPVSVGEGAIVGAGSVIVEDVPADALAVARGRQEGRPGWAARFRAARTGKGGHGG
jgi:bifunctional UDP-N-acetylglucosamine pyrophosphorylase/glucosamine-1-phosphate N-acetyltransferase